MHSRAGDVEPDDIRTGDGVGSFDRPAQGLGPGIVVVGDGEHGWRETIFQRLDTEPAAQRAAGTRETHV